MTAREWADKFEAEVVRCAEERVLFDVPDPCEFCEDRADIARLLRAADALVDALRCSRRIAKHTEQGEFAGWHDCGACRECLLVAAFRAAERGEPRDA